MGEATSPVSHFPWGVNTVLSTAERFMGTYFSFTPCFDPVSSTDVSVVDTYTNGGTADQVGVAVFLLLGLQGLFKAVIILDV